MILANILHDDAPCKLPVAIRLNNIFVMAPIKAAACQ